MTMTGLPLLPPRVADFQALWYLTIVALGMLTLAGIATSLVVRHLGSIWRDGDRPVATLIATGVSVMALLLLLMIATALGGLAGMWNR